MSNPQDSVTIREGILELPSYPVAAPEKSPVFDCKWCYQRARRSVYPYPLNDNCTGRVPETRTWKALYLENEYVEACVLPEIGGRLFYAIDKTNGYDIFYHQEVVKPANIAMNGAWISGGVEWNAFHHHRITTHMPCDWRLAENADGSKTIWVGETERRHRMSWAIGITLRPGSSVIEIDGRLVNGTENTESFLFWANAATHANPDYQIIFPQNTEFAAFHAKNSICHWPIATEPFNGTRAYADHVDVSWWKNHPCGNSFFAFELPENFIGGYDYGRDAGTMLVGNRHIIRGGKFWSWGPKSGWPTRILTDRNGHYIELMVGAYSDSQPDYTWIAPGESKTFHMDWYGVRNLRGIKMGDASAALNMDVQPDGSVFLAVNGTRRLDALAVQVLRRGEKVFEETISVAPDAPWSRTIPLPSGAQETDLTMRLVDLATGRARLSYTPVFHDPAKPCPPEVQTPKRPADIESTEECYFVGLRAEQFHNPYVEPTDYYEEVLRRDPLDSRANTRMGVYWRTHWDSARAEKHLRAALVRPTASYTRVKDGEALYNLGLLLADEGRADEAVDALYRASWTYEYNAAANLALARLLSAQGEPAAALERLDEALDHNARLLDAKCLKASLLRLAGRRDEALALADAVLAFDPLCAYAAREDALLRATPEADAAFDALMRDEPESYLELALKYRAAGLEADATALLQRIDAKVPYPTVKLHLGKIDEFLALDIGLCHPFRRETAKALEALAAARPDAAKAWYYLGNVYGNKDPAKAASFWKKAVELRTDRQTDLQTGEQTDRQTDRQADRQTSFPTPIAISATWTGNGRRTFRPPSPGTARPSTPSPTRRSSWRNSRTRPRRRVSRPPSATPSSTPTTRPPSSAPAPSARSASTARSSATSTTCSASCAPATSPRSKAPATSTRATSTPCFSAAMNSSQQATPMPRSRTSPNATSTPKDTRPMSKTCAAPAMRRSGTPWPAPTRRRGWPRRPRNTSRSPPAARPTASSPTGRGCPSRRSAAPTRPAH